uniref:Uncharacterized protein n=1 Tax=Arundo donax TaxID=35708 RepID=A0A0A9H857_ARUDO
MVLDFFFPCRRRSWFAFLWPRARSFAGVVGRVRSGCCLAGREFLPCGRWPFSLFVVSSNLCAFQFDAFVDCPFPLGKI